MTFPLCLASGGPPKSPKCSFCLLPASDKHCRMLFFFSWPVLFSSWSVTFGIKSHLGKSQTAATKPNSTGGRLITQLINPTDVIVSAHFFITWMHTSHVAEIGLGPVAKCLFFFFLIRLERLAYFLFSLFYALVTHFWFSRKLSPFTVATDGIAALSAGHTI